jgi:hypothetical protein
MGRRPIGPRAMTAAERQRRRRELLRHPQVQGVTEAERRWLAGIDEGDLGVWNKIAGGSRKLKMDLKRREEELARLEREEEARERAEWRRRRPGPIGPILTKEDIRELFRPDKKRRVAEIRIKFR